MKKMINYPLFHRPVEITHALVAVASQENCDGPEHDLMMEAADYIRVLESLLGILSDMAHAGTPKQCVGEWSRWASQQKDLTPEFVKIVEENFWELLA